MVADGLGRTGVGAKTNTKTVVVIMLGSLGPIVAVVGVVAVAAVAVVGVVAVAAVAAVAVMATATIKSLKESLGHIDDPGNGDLSTWLHMLGIASTKHG